MTTINVSASASLGLLAALAAVGAGAWYYARHHTTGTNALAATSTTATASTGSTDTTAQLVQQQAAQEAAWRRTDQINDKKSQLSTVWNDIKQVTDQLNNIDAQSVPADIITAVSLQHEADCRAHTWALFAGGCAAKREATSEGYDQVAAQQWIVRKADLKRPLLVQLSKDDSTQRSLISDLAALGVTLSPVMVASS